MQLEITGFSLSISSNNLYSFAYGKTSQMLYINYNAFNTR